MSTQTSRSVLFTHTQPQQSFRLLELPPDLEELLTSKDAPVYATFPLKNGPIFFRKKKELTDGTLLNLESSSNPPPLPSRKQ